MSEVKGTLDLRLMKTLFILVNECSVTRTAEILGHTQPTISLALKRLRELLGDPILVRAGSTLVPTERGLMLRESLGPLLAEIDIKLSPEPHFDPLTTERRFCVVAANCLGTVFLPRIFSKLLQLAPKASLEVVAIPGSERQKQQLADGTIDLIVGTWPNPSEYLRYAPLLSTDIKCVVNRRHRFARRKTRITMTEYLEERHLSPTTGKMTQYSPIDGKLRELGLQRNISGTVPEYAIVPSVLTQTDLMFTTGAPFAEQIAKDPALVMIEAPVEFDKMDFYLLWHECKHHSPAHAWLRQMIREISSEMPLV